MLAVVASDKQQGGQLVAATCCRLLPLELALPPSSPNLGRLGRCHWLKLHGDVKPNFAHVEGHKASAVPSSAGAEMSRAASQQWEPSMPSKESQQIPTKELLTVRARLLSRHTQRHRMSHTSSCSVAVV
mmetsp:Transcript_53061/g.95517  ORF Transcript_53061/g.95517 Transcript_53061/m.95517 type:complete len:129 (+) Transcript_53061:2-388(+)